MLKLLELTKFRGFEDLQLSNLARLNFVTGTNGSGKTSILEAIFLVCGGANASLVASLNGFRGGQVWGMGYEVPFRSLFRDLDANLVPVISASTSILQKRVKKHYRKLEIKPSYSLAEGGASTAQPKQLSGIEFVFSGPSGTERNTWGWRTDVPKSMVGQVPASEPGAKVLMLGGELPKNRDSMTAVFVSPYVRDLAPQNHQALTELTKQRRIGEVVEALKIVHSSIVDIQPLMENNIPMIYADVGGPSLLPLSLLGSGVSNVLHIVLPLLQYQNAVILVDEFEDGLHHSLFAPLLRIVFTLAAKYNHQVFISTHSDEFLRQLISVAQADKFEDIALFRFAKRGMKGVVPRYSVEEARDVLESNLDIR